MKQNINEIRRMQQLAGLLKENQLNENNMETFSSNDDLVSFLNNNVDKVKEAIPDLESIQNLKFTKDNDGTIEGEEVIIPIDDKFTSTSMEYNDSVFSKAPITFNINPTGGEEWGSDTPITIDGKTFYYGYFNF